MKTDSNYGSVCLLLKGRAGLAKDYGPFNLSITSASNASNAIGTGYVVPGYVSNSSNATSTAVYTVTLPAVANRGTGDWSLEFHILPDSTTYTAIPLIANANVSVKFSSSQILSLYVGSTLIVSLPHTLSYYSSTDFTSVQFTKSSGTIYYFVNGTLLGSLADSHSFDWSGALSIIGVGCHIIKLDNVRFSTTARNTSTYTVDTDLAELPAYGDLCDPIWADVSLLVQPDGSGVADVSSAATTLTTHGTLTVDTYDRWLQGGSIKFNGSSYLSIASADMVANNMDVSNSESACWEVVVKFDNLTGTNDSILSNMSSSMLNGWHLYKDSSGNIKFDMVNNDGSFTNSQTLFTAVTGYSLIVVLYDGTGMYFGMNASGISTTGAYSWGRGNVSDMLIGSGFLNTGSIVQTYLHGHIASLRFTSSSGSFRARYQGGTGNYEAMPSLPYGTQLVPSSSTATKLLCHFDGSTVAASLTDSSTYGLTINQDSGTDFVQNVGSGQFNDSIGINASDINYTTPATYSAMPTSGSINVNSSTVNVASSSTWGVELTIWELPIWAAGTALDILVPIIEWGDPISDGNRIGMGTVYHRDTQGTSLAVWAQASSSYDSSGLTGISAVYAGQQAYTLGLFKVGPWLYLYNNDEMLERFVIPDAWGLSPGNEWVVNAGRMNNAMYNGSANDGVLHYGKGQYDEWRIVSGAMTVSGNYYDPLAPFSVGSGGAAALATAVTSVTTTSLNSASAGTIAASITCSTSASLDAAYHLAGALACATNVSLHFPPFAGVAACTTAVSLRPNWPEVRATASAQMLARLITPIAADPYWSNVILLVKGRDDGTGAQKDLSSYSHTLTMSGGPQNTGGVQGYGYLENSAEASPLIQATFGSEAVMGTGDWTMEFWGKVNFSAVDSFVLLLSNGTHDFGYVLSTGIMEVRHAGTPVLTTTTTFSSYTGSGGAYFQVSKHSGTLYLLVNGAIDTSVSDSNSWDWSGTFKVFHHIYDPLVDDVRITAGIARNFATYSVGAEFPQYPVIPHYSEPYFNNITLLLQPDGTSGFTDVSNHGTPLTVMGYPTTDFHFRKFAPGTLVFSSGYSTRSGSYAYSDDYLKITATNANTAGLSLSGPYNTLEIWFGLIGAAATDNQFYPIMSRVDSGLNYGWQLVRDTDNTVRFKVYHSSTLTVNANLGTMTAGFHKLVVNQVNQHVTVAFNGGLSTDLGTIVFPTPADLIGWGFSSDALIGAGYTGTGSLATLNGYVNSVRFTDGLARYGLSDTDVGQNSQMYYPLASSYTVPNSILSANVFATSSGSLKIPMTATCSAVASASGTLTNLPYLIGTPITVNVLSMNWQLSVPMFIDVYQVYSLSAAITINVNGYTLSVPLEIDVYEVYQLSAPIRVEVFPVYASGTGGQFVGTVVQLPSTNTQHWKLQVIVGGVDVSARLIGTCSIDAE